MDQSLLNDIEREYKQFSESIYCRRNDKAMLQIIRERAVLLGALEALNKVTENAVVDKIIENCKS